jgi:hypothetical protein
MSTILLDPAAMDATAGAIGEHAREIDGVVATLETACCADVPAHLAGWLAEELHEIALVCRLSSLLYTAAALDTATRAQQIAADQSLATAWPSLDAPFGDLTATPFGLQAALAGSTTVGGLTDGWTSAMDAPTTMTIGGGAPYTDSFPGGFTMTIGAPTWENDPFLRMASQLQNTNPGLSSQMLGVSGMLSESNADMARTILAPNGLTYHGGAYVDSGGDRGSISDVYPDPYVSGRYEVRP